VLYVFVVEIPAETDAAIAKAAVAAADTLTPVEEPVAAVVAVAAVPATAAASQKPAVEEAAAHLWAPSASVGHPVPAGKKAEALRYKEQASGLIVVRVAWCAQTTAT
jgi:hypothetical protein